MIDETLPVPGSGEAAEETGDDEEPASMLADVKRLKTVKHARRLADTLMQAHDLTTM